jgi:hypothetical protein
LLLVRLPAVPAAKPTVSSRGAEMRPGPAD